ncbi:MAG: hypothetical protein FWC70_08920 [Defluviitaleaceae bacterium]|nr:hypothetical protein [Defluviitaleaceae bacterium]
MHKNSMNRLETKINLAGLGAALCAGYKFLLFLLIVDAPDYIPQGEMWLDYLVLFSLVAYAIGFTLFILFATSNPMTLLNEVVGLTFAGAAHCFILIPIVYWGVGADIMMTFVLNALQSVHENVLAIMAITGSSAMIFANVFRYCQSKKYGIPFKVAYGTVRDTLDVFVIVVILIGFCAILPLTVALMAEQSGISAIEIILFFTVTVCMFVFVSFYGLKIEKSDYIRLKKPVRSKIVLWFMRIILLLLCVPMFVAYIFISQTPSEELFARTSTYSWYVILVALHVVIMFFVAFVAVERRMVDSQSYFKIGHFPMTVEINEITHLVTMRYSAEKWLLIPCVVTPDAENPEEKHLCYKKGSFKVKDLDDLDICQIEYRQVRPIAPEDMSEEFGDA